MKRGVLLLSLLAAPALAQQQPPAPGPKFVPAPAGVVYGDEPDRPQGFVEEVIEEERPEWRSESRPVAILRGLDKISGLVTDIRAPVGEVTAFDRLKLRVEQCRVPPEGVGEDAFVFLRIEDGKEGVEPVFSGWMFASSPALSAMDHQRYDVWVLNCATS